MIVAVIITLAYKTEYLYMHETRIMTSGQFIISHYTHTTHDFEVECQ